MLRSEDTGKLVLRVAIGVLLLLHGVGKLNQGIGFISSLVTSHGLPGMVAYGVYIGEIVAPVLMIAGLFTRAAAWVAVLNMLAAILLVHMGHIWTLDKNGGWAVEAQGLYLFGSLAVAFLGAGRFSIGGSNGRLN